MNEASPIIESEVITLLRAIDFGWLTVQEQFDEGSWTDRVFLVSNGWRVAIFNDAGDWDYIDRVISPDGRKVDFDTIYDTMPLVMAYDPSQEELDNIWRWKWGAAQYD